MTSNGTAVRGTHSRAQDASCDQNFVEATPHISSVTVASRRRLASLAIRMALVWGAASLVGPAAAEPIEDVLFATATAGVASGFERGPAVPAAFTPEAAGSTGDAVEFPLPADPLPGMSEATLGATVQCPLAAAAGFRPIVDARPVTVVDTIRRAAATTEVDAAYLMALADKESSFNPVAKAKTSSAEGLYQFIDQTWLDAVRSFGLRHGLVVEAAAIEREAGRYRLSDEELRRRVLDLRRDPYMSAVMAAEMLKRDKTRLEAEIGRPVTTEEYYLAHFLGPAGAERLLKAVSSSPKAAAARSFPAAARANRSIFTVRQGRRSRSATTTELYERLTGMMAKRIDRYDDGDQRVATLSALR